MKIKKSLNKKVVILGLLIILIGFLQAPVKSSCNNQTDDDPYGFLLNLNTDNENYEKAQCIKIFGNITNISDEVNIFDNIKITLKNGDWGPVEILNDD